MGQQFDRVAIALTPGGTEYLVLETEVIMDFGQGQGPKGGVVTVEDGWVVVRGMGEARLQAGAEAPGGAFPPLLTLRDAAGKMMVQIAAHPDPTGQPNAARVYVEGSTATLRLRDHNGNEEVLLEGAVANVWLGGKGSDGDIALFKSGEKSNRTTSHATIHLDGGGSSIRFRDAKANDHALLDGGAGNLWLGGKDANGDIVMYARGQTDNRITATATIHLNGNDSSIRLRDTGGNDHVFLDGAGGNLWLGGKEADGDVVLFARGEENNRDATKATIHLDGDAGDITLRNADCAEDFDVDGAENVEPGTVLVIDADGRLHPSDSAYDRRVAGVVSGAGSVRPGIVLDRRPGGAGRLPVALVGKVYCKVEATSAPVDVGDLLTSSTVRGHAMKARDPRRAFGAVIGKALAPLAAGTGLVPILVALQ